VKKKARSMEHGENRSQMVAYGLIMVTKEMSDVRITV